jgi:hypothetical protein
MTGIPVRFLNQRHPAPLHLSFAQQRTSLISDVTELSQLKSPPSHQTQLEDMPGPGARSGAPWAQQVRLGTTHRVRCAPGGGGSRLAGPGPAAAEWAAGPGPTAPIRVTVTATGPGAAGLSLSLGDGSAAAGFMKPSRSTESGPRGRPRSQAESRPAARASPTARVTLASWTELPA